MPVRPGPEIAGGSDDFFSVGGQVLQQLGKYRKCTYVQCCNIKCIGLPLNYVLVKVPTAGEYVQSRRDVIRNRIPRCKSDFLRLRVTAAESRDWTEARGWTEGNICS